MAAPTLNLETIPEELRQHNQWVDFRLEPRADENGITTLAKVPYSARSGHRASSTERSDWSSYELACKYRDRSLLDGIGFVFTDEDDYVGIDLDHVIDPDTGAWEPWARDYVDRVNTYTEYSISGTGVHMIAKGALPGSRHRKGHVEMYETDRFFTMSGRHVEGTPTTVEYRIPELKKLYREVFGADVTPPSTAAAAPGTSRLDDATLVEKASNAKDGPRFRQLWSGDTSGNGDDDSSADLALCNLLAFWSGGDLGQMDRLFRQSGLMRPKWDERRGAQPYGELTMAEALKGRTEFYRPFPMDPPTVELNLDHLDDSGCSALVAEVQRLRTERTTLQERIADLEVQNRLLVQLTLHPDNEVRRAVGEVYAVLAEAHSTLDRYGQPGVQVTQEGTVPISFLGIAERKFGVTDYDEKKRRAQAISVRMNSAVTSVVLNHETIRRHVNMDPITGEVFDTPQLRGTAYFRPLHGSMRESLAALVEYRAEKVKKAPKRPTSVETPEPESMYCEDHPGADLHLIATCTECLEVVADRIVSPVFGKNEDRKRGSTPPVEVLIASDFAKTDDDRDLQAPIRRALGQPLLLEIPPCPKAAEDPHADYGAEGPLLDVDWAHIERYFDRSGAFIGGA